MCKSLRTAEELNIKTWPQEKRKLIFNLNIHKLNCGGMTRRQGVEFIS